MAERDIVFNDVTSQANLFKLKEHLRELYRLLDRRHVNVTYGATVTLDLDEADSFRITLTGNITTVTLKNPDIGRVIKIVFLQDGVGSHTVAGWAGTVKLTGAAFAITGTAGAASSISLLYDGTNFYEIGRALDVR